MPSSRESVGSSAAVRVVTWDDFEPSMTGPAHGALHLDSPVFERTDTSAAPLAAFDISPTVGVPESVLTSARDAARATGYAEGWTAGLADAQAATAVRAAAEEAAAAAEAKARVVARERAIGALAAAADSVAHREVTAAREIEDQILTAALAIAESLVGHVLGDDEQRSATALARALQLAPTDGDVTVTMAEDDFAVLAASAAEAGSGTQLSADGMSLSQQRGLRTVTITADPVLAPGDAIASCGATEIDARLSAAVMRVREVLGR